jgi:hypothetical protein
LARTFSIESGQPIPNERLEAVCAIGSTLRACDARKCLSTIALGQFRHGAPMALPGGDDPERSLTQIDAGS